MEDLNDVAVGVGEIERITTVAVVAQGMNDHRPRRLRHLPHLVDRRGIGHDESEMVERPATGQRFARRDLVECQVVVATGEIDILIVRRPDHRHAEEPEIKIARPDQIGHAEREMAKTHSGRGGIRCRHDLNVVSARDTFLLKQGAACMF